MRTRTVWVLVGLILVVAAILVAIARPGPDRPLDPASSAHDGSKALATALQGYGVRVLTSTDPSAASGRIVSACWRARSSVGAIRAA